MKDNSFPNITLAIASDHAGFSYKQEILRYFSHTGITFGDLGAYTFIPEDDYPDYAVKAAQEILEKRADKAVLICGSAVGVSVVANKFPGIRAGVCHDTYSAHQAVEHDRINVLCIGQRVIGIALAIEIIETFIRAEFSNESRHIRRLEKLHQIETKNFKFHL